MNFNESVSSRDRYKGCLVSASLVETFVKGCVLARASTGKVVQGCRQTTLDRPSSCALLSYPENVTTCFYA